ncbi:MAG: inorganic diphosphatase, partial [Gemmatimonadaceae bacterium]
DKGVDDKIICVPRADPRLAEVREFSDVARHWQREIEHVVRIYKELQDLKVEVRGWADNRLAWEINEAARAACRDTD